MSITINGITCERFKGYPKENFNNCFESGSSVEDVLMCDYADRLTVLRALLGFDVNGLPVMPMRYDGVGSELLNLYVISAGPIEPMGVDKATLNPVTAMIPVHYGQLNYTQAEDLTYTEISVEGCSQFLTMSTGDKFLTDGTTPNPNRLSWNSANTEPVEPAEAPSMIIRMKDIVITKHNLSNLPSTAFTLPGCINSNSLYISEVGETFAARTLLCGNPSYSRTIGLMGTSSRWTVTTRLTHKNVDWQLFPRQTGGSLNYVPIYSNGSVQKYYTEVNFSGLI